MKTKKFSIKFYPRTMKLNKQGFAPIYCRIMANKKMELSTTKMINPDDWNVKTQRAKSVCVDAESINAYLDSFQSKVLEAHTKLFVSDEQLTAEGLKAVIFGIVSQEKTLLQVVAEHNTMFEKRIGKDYSYGSFKNYKTTKKYLEAFILHQYKKGDLSLSEVKYGFCEHYYSFLINERPCNNNGANKHIQRLKKIVNYAYKMGYVQSNNLLSYSLKFNPFHQYKLTWEEIEKLQSLNLQNMALRRVLDIFLFQCFTGLAYADVKKLAKKHLVKGIDSKLWISMSRTKTKREFTIPLFKTAMLILEKYSFTQIAEDESIFPVLSNQKMNAYLKIISEIAELKHPLSSHIARHTFATTITLQEGVPLETVSKLLGHSKIATTQIYSVVNQFKIVRGEIYSSKGDGYEYWIGMKSPLLLKEQIGTDGYPAVNISTDGKQKKVAIHRMLAITFIPNPENKPQINHKNGIKLDYVQRDVTLLSIYFYLHLLLISHSYLRKSSFNVQLHKTHGRQVAVVFDKIERSDVLV